MEKGNALGSTSAAGLADLSSTAVPVESTTTVTSVVTGVGTTAAEAMTKAVADRATEAAIDETRERLQQRHTPGSSTSAADSPATAEDAAPEPGSDDPKA